jgi:enoyl-CoA hydratase/carnithine racemase
LSRQSGRTDDNVVMSDRVIVETSDGIAHVRLNRPDKRNALDGEMFRAIADAGEQLKTDDDVGAVVISGEGKSFCAGLDLDLFSQLDQPADSTHPGAMQPNGTTHLGQQVAWVWQELPVPVIAAVHGHALGGGLQIALAADIRIVHPDTQLSVREGHYGLVPDMTGTFFLSRLVRPDIAKELTFTARIFDGREAAALGLVTRLSDDPVADAVELASEIAARSPEAIRAAKRLFNRLANEAAPDQFAEERREIAAIVERLAGEASRP